MVRAPAGTGTASAASRGTGTSGPSSGSPAALGGGAASRPTSARSRERRRSRAATSARREAERARASVSRRSRSAAACGVRAPPLLPPGGEHPHHLVACLQQCRGCRLLGLRRSCSACSAARCSITCTLSSRVAASARASRRSCSARWAISAAMRVASATVPAASSYRVGDVAFGLGPRVGEELLCLGDRRSAWPTRRSGRPRRRRAGSRPRRPRWRAARRSAGTAAGIPQPRGSGTAAAGSPRGRPARGGGAPPGARAPGRRWRARPPPSCTYVSTWNRS